MSGEHLIGIRSAEYWRARLRALSLQRHLPDDWQPWGTTTFADGTPIPQEFLASLDVRSEALRKGVRLYLTSPDDLDGADELDSVGAWVSVHGSDAEYPETVRYTSVLHLNFVTNHASAEVAERLLAKWISPSISAAEMEQCIAGDPGANLT